MWDLSFPSRDWTHSLCTVRQTLNHWTTRDVPGVNVLNLASLTPKEPLEGDQGNQDAANVMRENECVFSMKFLLSSSLLFFNHSVMADSLWPHGLQHTGLPGPSLSPRVCSNSCPVSWWCHLTFSAVIRYSMWWVSPDRSHMADFWKEQKRTLSWFSSDFSPSTILHSAGQHQREGLTEDTSYGGRPLKDTWIHPDTSHLEELWKVDSGKLWKFF